MRMKKSIPETYSGVLFSNMMPLGVLFSRKLIVSANLTVLEMGQRGLMHQSGVSGQKGLHYRNMLLGRGDDEIDKYLIMALFSIPPHTEGVVLEIFKYIAQVMVL